MSSSTNHHAGVASPSGQSVGGPKSLLSRLCGSGLVWSWVALLVFFLDQASKHWVLHAFKMGEVRPVTSFFNLVLVLNPGAAWSFLATAGGWQRWFFAAISTLASLLILGWLFTLTRAERWSSLSLVLILGGAVGNLYDRIVYGAVVDFLDFYWASYHFPAFNLADSAITMGAVMMVIDLLFLQGAKENRK